MKPLLLVRADASPQIGTGHVMRCLALAQAWRRAGGEVVFVCAELPEGLGQRLAREGMECRRIAAPPGSPEDAAAVSQLAGETKAPWIVADGYRFGADYQTAVRGPGRALLVLDDYGHAAHYSAELVLNQNAGAQEGTYRNRDERTRLLLGASYALLREEFLHAPKPASLDPRNVLVTFGGSDPENITGRVVEALLPLAGVRGIVVGGAGNPHLAALEALAGRSAGRLELRRDVTDMAALMREAGFAITAAGSTSWELAYFGIPSIQIVIAENQAGIARAMAAAGASLNLGDRHAISAEQIREAVGRLTGDHALRAAMRERGRELVDGRGAERVVTHLRAGCLELRPAEARDERRIWEWANDPVTRAAYFNSELISWEEHQAWFRRQLSDVNARLEIGEAPGPFGLIRFSLDDGEADVSISLAPESRGLGLAAPLILRGSHALLRAGRTRVIHAWIKAENTASRAAFQRAGYRPRGPGETRGHPAEHYTLERAEVPEWERV